MTGVAAFGLFVELVEHFVEGMVHVSTMADDYYRFVETAHMLRGENKQRTYRLGDKVIVRVLRVNMDAPRWILDWWIFSSASRKASGERDARTCARKAGHPGKRIRPGVASGGRKGSGADLRLVVGGRPSCPSLKFRMALPIPLPRPGRRLAPKMTMTIARMMSSSGIPMRPMIKLLLDAQQRLNYSTATAPEEYPRF